MGDMSSGKPTYFNTQSKTDPKKHYQSSRSRNQRPITAMALLNSYNTNNTLNQIPNYNSNSSFGGLINAGSNSFKIQQITSSNGKNNINNNKQRRPSLRELQKLKADEHFVQLYTYNKTAKGLNKEYKDIKHRAEDLLKSFQTPNPRFISLNSRNKGSQSFINGWQGSGSLSARKKVQDMINKSNKDETQMENQKEDTNKVIVKRRKRTQSPKQQSQKRNSNQQNQDEDSIEGDDDTVAYFRPRRKQDKLEEKQEKLMSVISGKSNDPSVQQYKFYNERKQDSKDKYQIEQHNHYLDNRRRLNQSALLRQDSKTLESINERGGRLSPIKSNMLKLQSPRLMFEKDGRIENIDDINTLQEYEIRLLYKAKCEDLQIPEVEDQYEKFRENCLINSMNGKLKLNNFNLGPKSAKILADLIIRNAQFSQFILSDNFMGNEGIKHLSDALTRQNHIIRLDFSTNDMTNEGSDYLFKSLLHNQSLIDLDISSREGRFRNRIQAKGVEMLRQVLIHNPFLQILNLAGNAIKNEGVKVLCQAILQSTHKSLISLDIAENEITHTACDSLHKLLLESNLLRINLKGNNLGNPGAEKISHALYFSRSKLTYLNLASCQLLYLGIIKVLDAVKHNYQLQTLILDDNKAGKGQSFQLMSSLMSQNRSLVHLSLQNLSIDDSLAIPLGDGLHNNTRLKSLNLSFNSIGNEGAASIANALSYKGNTSNQTYNGLRELNLSHNDIGEDGGLQICKMIQSNKALLKLQLSYNNIGDLSGQELIKSINDNDKVEMIDLQNNQMNLRYVEFVEAKCKKNKKENHKNMRPQYEKDVKFLRIVTAKYPNLKRRMDRAAKNNKFQNQKYNEEMLNFDKLRNEMEHQAHHKSEQKLSNDIEMLQIKINNLSNQNKNQDIYVRDQRDKALAKSRALKNEIQIYKRQIIEVNAQNQVYENRLNQMKSERLSLLKQRMTQHSKEDIEMERDLDLNKSHSSQMSITIQNQGGRQSHTQLTGIMKKPNRESSTVSPIKEALGSGHRNNQKRVTIAHSNSSIRKGLLEGNSAQKGFNLLMKKQTMMPRNNKGGSNSVVRKKVSSNNLSMGLQSQQTLGVKKMNRLSVRINLDKFRSEMPQDQLQNGKANKSNKNLKKQPTLQISKARNLSSIPQPAQQNPSFSIQSNISDSSFSMQNQNFRLSTDIIINKNQAKNTFPYNDPSSQIQQLQQFQIQNKQRYRDTTEERMSKAGAFLNEILENSTNSIISSDLEGDERGQQQIALDLDQ
eukprot:403349489